MKNVKIKEKLNEKISMKNVKTLAAVYIYGIVI